jgi:hypothetical protein
MEQKICGCSVAYKTHLGYLFIFRIKVNTLAFLGLVSPGLGVVG